MIVNEAIPEWQQLSLRCDSEPPRTEARLAGAPHRVRTASQPAAGKL
jgi:hypothetical protein